MSKESDSPFSAEARLKAAEAHKQRSKLFNKLNNVPKHVLRVVDAEGSLSRIKVHKEDRIEQLHATLASSFKLEPGTFVIGLNAERTDCDFRSNSQLIIGKALPKKGTKIWLHPLTEAERELLYSTGTSVSSCTIGAAATGDIIAPAINPSTRATLRQQSNVCAVHSMSDLQQVLSTTNANALVAVCFTAAFQGDATEDNRALTLTASTFANEVNFLSVFVRNGGETEEVYIARELGISSFPSIVIYDNAQSTNTPRWRFTSIEQAHIHLSEHFKTEEGSSGSEYGECSTGAKEESGTDYVVAPTTATTATTATSITPPAPGSIPPSSMKTIAASNNGGDDNQTSTKLDDGGVGVNGTGKIEYTTEQLHDLALAAVTEDLHVKKLLDIVTDNCTVEEAFYLLYHKQKKNFITEKHLVDIAKAVDQKFGKTKNVQPRGYVLPLHKILPIEIRLLGRMNEQTKLAIAQEPVLRDMEDMVEQGLLSMKDVIGFQAELKSGGKPAEVANAVQALLRKAAHLQRESFQINKLTAASKRFHDLYKSKAIQGMLWQLNWSNKHAILQRYTGLQVCTKYEIVGLQVVKDHLQKLVSDARGRVARGEDLPKRHHVIVGRLGTGRKTSANLIGWLYSCLSGMKGDPNVIAKHQESTSQPIGASSTTEKRQSQHTLRLIGPQKNNFQFIEHLRILSDDDPSDLEIIENTVYFTRLIKGASPKPENAHEGKILQDIRDAGGLVIFAVDDEDALHTLLELEYFRTEGPDILKLADVGISELAQLSLQAMRARGYRLLQTSEEEHQVTTMSNNSGSSSSNATSNQSKVNNPREQELMEYIIKNNFDAEMMRESNAYLAKDMLERAITKKNERLDRLGLSAAGRLWLKPFDFGIELLTAQQIERNRQKVEYKLSQMVGWGGTEQEGSPLWFLNQCKRMVELSETNQRRDGNKTPTKRGGNTKGNNGDNDTKPEQKRNQAKIDDDDNTEDNSSGDRSVLQNSWPGGTWITGVRIFHFLWFTLFVNISIYHTM